MAVAVLAVALLGAMHAWAGAQRAEALAREEMIAHAAINKIISQMRATPFHQLTTTFSGGAYPGSTDPNRLLPGQFPVNVAEDDLVKTGGSSLRGVRVETYAFAGAEQISGRWYGPAIGTAEMRVVLINDEDPIEAELGEVPGATGTGNRDGLDLNGDGSIQTVPCSSYTTSTTTAPFGQDPQSAAGVQIQGQPLFPRLLAGETLNPPPTPTHAYRNISELTLLPVAVQVRWWSRVGRPQQITVITCLANRSGGTQ
ncbi:MAG TPA: hypothetical protein VGP72_32740 [Planctomycetota bacterium]|jgi:type II secretory pathway pseudopilin PulG